MTEIKRMMPLNAKVVCDTCGVSSHETTMPGLDVIDNILIRWHPEFNRNMCVECYEGFLENGIR